MKRRMTRSRSRLADEALIIAFIASAYLLHRYHVALPPLDMPRFWPWWMWAGAAALAALLAFMLARLGYALVHRVPYRERIFRTPVKGPEWGYVYVLANASMPGVYKIGSTGGSPQDRARELHTTGVAAPFTVRWALYCEFARRIEIQTHRLLTNDRVSADREFFRAELAAIKKAVRQAQEHVTAARAH
jgi:hypothetical protein